MKTAGYDITRPIFGENVSEEKMADVKPKTEEIPLTKPGVTRKITLTELKKQDREHPWFVVNGEVYDGTPFLNEHPGGGDSIILVAGEDASEDFFAIHSAEGKAKLAQVRGSQNTGKAYSVITVPYWNTGKIGGRCL